MKTDERNWNQPWRALIPCDTTPTDTAEQQEGYCQIISGSQNNGAAWEPLFI